MNTLLRVGFPCKWLDSPSQINGIKPNDPAKKFNTGTTTITWLNRQSKATAEEKLWFLMKNNIESIRLLVEKVGGLNDHLRMVRLSSDILPAFTEPTWKYFWQLPDVKQYAETQFRRVGDLAKQKSVRLSFHPGQFCVLASDNPDIVSRSIEEFEYHATMAAWMGFGQRFQDFKINVHISGRAGPQGIRSTYNRLSPEARNCITIENEENAWGLNDCLELADICPIVLDIHHFWCREGEYIQPTDNRYQSVIESWRDVRPVIHYSYSRNEHFPVDFKHDCMPNMKSLLSLGFKKQKLRAHSDFYPNRVVNEYALSFLETADIMAESKSKNLASFELAKCYFGF